MSRMTNVFALAVASVVLAVEGGSVRAAESHATHFVAEHPWKCFYCTNALEAAVRFLLNVLLSASVGLGGVMQFFTQKVGEPLMGESRYISFAVLMASAIFFSSGVGLFLGEWKGTGRGTKACLTAGLLILVLSFALISWGGKT